VPVIKERPGRKDKDLPDGPGRIRRIHWREKLVREKERRKKGEESGRQGKGAKAKS